MFLLWVWLSPCCCGDNPLLLLLLLSHQPNAPKDNAEAVGILLEAGADPLLEREGGRSALEEARRGSSLPGSSNHHARRPTTQPRCLRALEAAAKSRVEAALDAASRDSSLVGSVGPKEEGVGAGRTGGRQRKSGSLLEASLPPASSSSSSAAAAAAAVASGPGPKDSDGLKGSRRKKTTALASEGSLAPEGPSKCFSSFQPGCGRLYTYVMAITDSECGG